MYKICGLILISSLFLFGCGTNLAEHDANELNSAITEVKNNNMNYEKIVNGSIYEITENNFIEGLNHAFSNSELNEIKNLIVGSDVTETNVQSDEVNPIYILNFYDEKESEIYTLAIDNKGKIYDSLGHNIHNDNLWHYILNNKDEWMISQNVK